MLYTALGRFTLLVNDYDEALRYYTDLLGFEPIVDISASNGLRFVHIRVPGQGSIGIWLLQASTDEQRALVGRQTGGEPCAVLYTDNCRATYEVLRSRGVHFRIEPREDSDAIVAHFLDLYGNEFVLVEMHT